MAVFTPSTQVILCSVPLEKDQKNQLDFASSTAQYNYFYGTRQFTYTNFTYQRKDNTLRVPAEFDTLYKCNYVMYQNTNFGSKWFYAFIDSMEYINQNCTALHLKTDVFQTWILSAVFKPSFVAREHVEYDTPLIHILPENIQTGEVEAQRIINVSVNMNANLRTDFTSNYVVVICTSEGISIGGHTYETGYGDFFGGIPNMCSYYAIEGNEISQFITEIGGQTSKIVSAYCVARNAVTLAPWFTFGTNDQYQAYTINDYTSPADVTVSTYISAGKLFSGYTPRNKKLLCYPYNYITLTNFNGSSVDLKLENFTNTNRDTQVTFSTTYSPTINSSLFVFPKSYLQQTANIPTYFSDKSYNYGVEFNAFPQIAWLSDLYVEYLALNANSMEMQKISWGIDAAKLFVGSGTDIKGSIMGGVNLAENIMSYYANLEDKSNQPKNVHGTPTGSNQLKSGSAGVFALCKSVKPQYSAIIDQYFDLYGYNVSTLKTPQFTSRPYWNYIETKEINIEGDIPQDDMQELKDIFNKGVTVWHNPAYFLDYSRNNAPT